MCLSIFYTIMQLSPAAIVYLSLNAVKLYRVCVCVCEMCPKKREVCGHLCLCVAVAGCGFVGLCEQNVP